MASGQEHGTVRLKFMDKGERKFAGQVDFHTSRISGGALAPPTSTTYDAIPRNPPVQIAGARMVMEFIADATDIIESEESDCEIDLLVVEPSGRVVGRETVKLAAMTGFTPAGTVDITATAATPARVAYKDAPEGQAYRLDPSGKTRVYLGDDA